MEYLASIDISSFIWCQDDFASNTNKYYLLMQTLPSLYTHITNNKTNVLLRAELYDQIILGFPYNKIPSANFDFQISTLGFLSNLGARMVVYPRSDATTTTSKPQLIKDHFSTSTNLEVRYLINRLHTIRVPESKFFTFSHIWNCTDNLNTINDDTYEIETVCYDSNVDLEAFFLRYRRVFEHNPKHNLHRAIGNISPLSCYNERIGDKNKAQNLLDRAEQNGDTFYNFDIANNVYVIFRNTNGNLYHGYDEPNLLLIPSEIRKKFNK